MRLIRNCSTLSASALCWLALTSVLIGLDAGQVAAAPSETPPPAASTNTYVRGALRVGDHVSVELTGTGETVAPIQQEISSDGTIRLPFIDTIVAVGKTPGQLQNDIHEAYVPAWYKHLSVTVTTPLRFFYVGGQVLKGDRFPYTSPITVTAAIQAAGGFDPYANRKKVRLTRVDGTVIIINCLEVLKNPAKDPPVYPGDKIDVPRRFW
jgi:protein involved in polysaccharide export with SLBB domain